MSEEPTQALVDVMKLHDLVERLRGPVKHPQVNVTIKHEAADEIEKLRRGLERITLAIDVNPIKTYQLMIKIASATLKGEDQ